MHPVGHIAQFAVGLDVVEQVHAEVIQAQIGDGDTGLQILQLDDFFLQAAQLLLAVRHVVGLRGQHVVVAGGGHVGDHHPAFDTLLEVDVFVKRNVGPVVDQLDAAIGRADTIHPAKALDDAHRVPVDVVVDDVVAVLQVLAFGDAVGTDQQIDFVRFFRQHHGFLFRARGEQGEQLLEVVAALVCAALDGGLRRALAGDLGGVDGVPG